MLKKVISDIYRELIRIYKCQRKYQIFFVVMLAVTHCLNDFFSVQFCVTLTFQ